MWKNMWESNLKVWKCNPCSLSVFHWPELGHMIPGNSREGWECCLTLDSDGKEMMMTKTKALSVTAVRISVVNIDGKIS